MKIIKETFKQIKESAKPMLGSYYILDGAIFYSTVDQGIEHSKLWKEIVLHSGIFDKLVYENKKDLMEAVYAADRGRVTWYGKFNTKGEPDLSDNKGHFIVYGTPGCKAHREKIKTIFGLKKLRKEIKVKEDWHTDEHYKIKDSDKNTLEDMVRLLGGKDKFNIQTTHIARIVEDSLKEKVRKILKEKTPE